MNFFKKALKETKMSLNSNEANNTLSNLKWLFVTSLSHKTPLTDTYKEI